MTKPDLFLPFFPIVFIAGWLGACFFISRLGWQSFAQRYSATERPSGSSFNCPFARFKAIFASYRNGVRVIFSEKGIYVYPLILFRAFHPPFLVPWEKVVGLQEKRGFWGKLQELEVRDGVEEIHIILTEEALSEFRRYKKTPNQTPEPTAPSGRGSS